MRALALQSVTEPPSENDLSLYPDFLIGCLLRDGVGRIEADLSLQRDGVVEFVLTQQHTGQSRVVAALGTGYFRSVLARFGYRCHEDMLYWGHQLFCCEFERDGQTRTHRFSIFMCNEPTAGCWLRLYLYGIDGVFPSFTNAA